jgi:receptor protein-tyrosine kinase
MAGPPKPSLVERLMQDRLRSGDLEASAAHLLQLAQGTQADPTRLTVADVPAGAVTGDAGMNLLMRPPPVIAFRGVSAAEPSFSAGTASSPVPDGPPPLVPLSLMPDHADLPALPLNPINLAGSLGVSPTSVGSEATMPPTPIVRVDLPPSSGPPVPGVAPAAPPSSGFPSNPPLEPLTSPTLASQSAIADQPDLAMPNLVMGAPAIDAVALERGGMLDWSRTRSRISEEFRLVQRQILRAAFGPGAEPGFSNLLLVTSARPGEGKSFTAVNLAGSIARQGDNHVLLIDADSKRDSFCYALGLAESRGLLDLVANPKLDPSSLIVKTPIERLSILPVGRERERSAELFSTKEMTRLIQSLGRRYADRLLILDAPPCLSTSDPAVLAPVVGQILFVVEADRTQRDEVEASLDLIQACPNITLVLNKQQISSRYTFGAYSSYYSS